MTETAEYVWTTKIRETEHATLLRGRRTNDGTEVVVKLVRSEYPSALELAKLRREHAILSSLALPGVVRTLGLTTVGGRLGLVLEHFGERSLRELVQAGRLPLGRFLELAEEVTELVAAVHRRDILHKDLKPDHFAFDARTGALKLIDFGIATGLSREDQPPVLPSTFEGTLAYISPEQTGRMNRAVDQRSDLYSLGVMLYELATGKLPFVSGDPLELIHSHIARRPTLPSELAPELPAPVSHIILKLLAKVPEERYQSAAGLLADLRRASALLCECGRVEPFPLGLADRSNTLHIPQRLYGREAEIACLHAAFERVRGGAAELVLLAGPSGVGKSALAQELHKQLVRCGHFVSGKFDQLKRALPYSALADACRELLRTLLAKPTAELVPWAERLRAALGAQGSVVAHLVPELTLVISEQPPAPALGPNESQHRFELLFQRFLQLFASREHPLVLYLDDLQWADSASLRLLKAVLTGPERGYLLLLGAYRDNEVGPAHPLSLCLDELREAGASIGAIRVGPLGPSEVRELFRDALGASDVEVGPLATLALEKTLGNPFFLTQFLSTLASEQLLVFDPASCAFTWQLEQIERVMVSDNVLDLLVQKIHRLGAGAQELLQFAACIGHRFDLATLATVAARPAGQVAEALWEPLSRGLLIPLDAHYSYARESEPSAPAETAPLNADYRFLHDRVQQAAYALLDAEAQRAAHLRIGRLLLAKWGDPPPDERLFELAGQLNLGAALIPPGPERRRLAELNLRAGRRARDSAAHEAAIKLLRASLGLREGDPWQTDYAIAQAAHYAIVECEIALGRDGDALAELAAIDDKWQPGLDRAAAQALRMLALTKMNHAPEAVQAGVEAAAMLGVELPTSASELGPANQAAFAALQAQFSARGIASLVDLAPMSDPHALAKAHVFAGLAPCCFISNPPLLAHVLFRAVELSLAHGNPPVAPQFYAGCAQLHGSITGDYATAYQIGQVAVALAERAQYGRGAAVGEFVFGNFVCHWARHVSEAIAHLRRGQELSLEYGDQLHFGYAALYGTLLRVFAGARLDELKAELDNYVELLHKTRDQFNLAGFTGIKLMIAALEGRERDDGHDEPAYAESIREMPILRALHLIQQSIARYFAEDYRAALALADEAEPLLGFLQGLAILADHVFYRALACAALLPSAAPEERAALLFRLDRDEERLSAWARTAPENHAPRSALVAAERASACGLLEQASAGFEHALALAETHGFGQLEALGNELLGTLKLRTGRVKLARFHLLEAFHGYRHWGANVKLARLSARFPELLARAIDLDRPAFLNTAQATLSSAQLDLAAAVRVVQAIMSELVLDKLIEHLMRSLVVHAGAERGYLILDQEGRLSLVAGLAVESDRVRIGREHELEQSDELSVAVVQYVARSREPVLLSRAAEDGRFVGDPYLARVNPKSLLCVPMVHQGRLRGVLYLEHRSASHVFDPGRSALIHFLAAQAAIAIENATLYERLEQRVAQRTAALAGVNEQLSQSIAQLSEAQRRLIDASRQAGMADVAISILHNVGNVLNSVNVSANLVEGLIQQSKASGIGKVAALLHEHSADLGRFLAEDERGKRVPDYLERLSTIVAGEKNALLEELHSLRHNIEHIKVVVAMQQAHAKPGGVRETVAVAELLDDAIGLDRLSCPEFEGQVERAYAELPKASLDRHKVLQIVMNLLSNARRAVRDAGDRNIVMRAEAHGGSIAISVEDRGAGIAREHLPRVFQYGFTTKADGHGFGLHASANAARELGGSMRCHSDGPGRGAIFTLELPLDASECGTTSGAA